MIGGIGIAGAGIVGVPVRGQPSHSAGEGLQALPPGPAQPRGVEHLAAVCCRRGAQAVPADGKLH